ncbi:UvrD-helicase domain-containing protein [Natronococcus jeotgali]|uniref:UvrD-helicase domain-containing protein n=1 Tax=Natronococcus jeotgali TaxID=413812 RepID=UPI0009FF8551|nr:ATP-dependent helicase [Natronococcus jeotgali]
MSKVVHSPTFQSWDKDGAAVVRIAGVPGAGKTYTVFQEYMHQKKKSGYNASDFIVVSFTKAHTDDCTDKFVDVWEEECDDTDKIHERIEKLWEKLSLEDNVSTFHARVWRILSANGLVDSAKRQIIDPENDADLFRGYWKERGYSFVDTDTNPLELVQKGTEPDGKANKIVAVDEWLAQKYLPVDKVHRSPVDVPIPRSDLIDEIRAWREWKQDQKYYQHHDYVKFAVEYKVVPPAKIIVIDEYQDYSPLEHKLMTIWRDSGVVDEVVIVGDGNQSIFGFKGASRKYFEGTPVDDEHVKSVSWRCPASISNVACAIMDGPVMSSHPDETSVGDVGTVPVKGRRDLGDAVRRTIDQHDSVFLLARTNYQVGKIATALQREGIPFTTLGDKLSRGEWFMRDDESGPWSDEIIDVIRALRKASDTGNVPGDLADTLVSFTSNGQERRKMADAVEFDGLGSDGYAVELMSAFPQCGSVSDIVSKLQVPDLQKEMIRGAMTSDVELEPENVKVDTIHCSKGDEADAVLLFDGYTTTLQKRFIADNEMQEEERRLYYVGVTRARKELQIVSGFVGAEICPFFRSGIPRYYESDEQAFENTEVKNNE